MLRSIVVAVLLLVCISLAQEAPPLLSGQWQDTVCNHIPSSVGLYQKRTTFYGLWNTDTQSGFWDETQEVYADAECNGQKQYEIFMSGTYHLTGKKSTDVEDFWNINYFVDTRTIRVFTLTFQNMLLDETSCGIGQVVLGRSMDITDVRCAVLNIVPFSECPTTYDIIRREGTRIWWGSHFGGEPYRYNSNCQEEDRLKDYDHFGLGALDLYAYQYGLGDYGEVGTYSGLDSYLNIDALREFSGASSLIVSIASICIAIIALI